MNENFLTQKRFFTTNTKRVCYYSEKEHISRVVLDTTIIHSMMFGKNDNNDSIQGNNAARILNMAVSNQLQQQQNFRLHQQRFLAPNPNRKPSQDDLFEMASMLLDAPQEDEPKTSWMNRSTVISPSNSMMMTMNTLGGGPTFSLPINCNQNTMKNNNNYNIIGRASPTNVGSGDLFDDDELNLVLGDVTQPPQSPQFQTITPETSERNSTGQDLFLPEMTLEEMLKNSESPTNNQENQDQWCLIDFGDDDQDVPVGTKRPHSLHSQEEDNPIKKSRQQ